MQFYIGEIRKKYHSILMIIIIVIIIIFYPRSPLALAVFSGALQFINDKITRTTNHLL